MLCSEWAGPPAVSELKLAYVCLLEQLNIWVEQPLYLTGATSGLGLPAAFSALPCSLETSFSTFLMRSHGRAFQEPHSPSDGMQQKIPNIEFPLIFGEQNHKNIFVFRLFFSCPGFLIQGLWALLSLMLNHTWFCSYLNFTPTWCVPNYTSRFTFYPKKDQWEVQTLIFTFEIFWGGRTHNIIKVWWFLSPGPELCSSAEGKVAQAGWKLLERQRLLSGQFTLRKLQRGGRIMLGEAFLKSWMQTYQECVDYDKSGFIEVWIMFRNVAKNPTRIQPEARLWLPEASGQSAVW